DGQAEEDRLKQLPIVQKVFGSEDEREGLRAFAEKRKPVWQGADCGAPLVASHQSEACQEATMRVNIEDVTTQGLCMGCGACHSLLGPDAVALLTADDGLHEPVRRRDLTEREIDVFNAVCPGVNISVPDYVNTDMTDPMWGPRRMLWKGYSSDPEIRFQASSGGALTSLSLFVLESGLVEQIVHLAPDPNRPMLSRPHRSRTREQVLAAMGSRYSPSAPLSDIADVLAEGRTFAFVGKPCDVTALQNLSRLDERVAQLCKYTFTLFCGGFPGLGKYRPLLSEWNVAENDLSWFRYRGHGCPGQTAAGTKDGRTFQVNFWDLWDDETTWQSYFRCRFCPDSIGLSADIAAMDCWQDANPKQEDEGWNSLLARTEAGEQVLKEALEANYIKLTEPWTSEHLEWSQPHQSRRRRGILARYAAFADAGVPVPRVEETALEFVSHEPGSEAFAAEQAWTARKLTAGANRRPTPKIPTKSASESGPR
ncbi:Coenzyme F420 hydrogenase/dehydrogenase, beta subunit C-terminal domain, partial [Mesorhizobium shangrilense]